MSSSISIRQIAEAQEVVASAFLQGLIGEGIKATAAYNGTGYDSVRVTWVFTGLEVQLHAASDDTIDRFRRLRRLVERLNKGETVWGFSFEDVWWTPEPGEVIDAEVTDEDAPGAEDVPAAEPLALLTDDEVRF